MEQDLDFPACAIPVDQLNDGIGRVGDPVCQQAPLDCLDAPVGASNLSATMQVAPTFLPLRRGSADFIGASRYVRSAPRPDISVEEFDGLLNAQNQPIAWLAVNSDLTGVDEAKKAQSGLRSGSSTGTATLRT